MSPGATYLRAVGPWVDSAIRRQLRQIHREPLPVEQPDPATVQKPYTRTGSRREHHRGRCELQIIGRVQRGRRTGPRIQPRELPRTGQPDLSLAVGDHTEPHALRVEGPGHGHPEEGHPEDWSAVGPTPTPAPDCDAGAADPDRSPPGTPDPQPARPSAKGPDATTWLAQPHHGLRLGPRARLTCLLRGEWPHRQG